MPPIPPTFLGEPFQQPLICGYLSFGGGEHPKIFFGEKQIRSFWWFGTTFKFWFLGVPGNTANVIDTAVIVK